MELISSTDFILKQTDLELLKEKQDFKNLSLNNYGYANFLKQDLTDEMFEGENKLFLNFKKIGSKHYENNRRVVIGIGFKNGIHKKVEDILQSTSKNCYVELSEIAIKRIFG